MDLDITHGHVEKVTKVNIEIIKNMVMEFSPKKITEHTKDSIKMVNNTVQENIQTQVEKFNMGYGRRES